MKFHSPVIVFALVSLFCLADAYAQDGLKPIQKRLLFPFSAGQLNQHRASRQTQPNTRPLASAGVIFAPLTPSGPTSYFPQAGNGQCKEVLGTTNIKVNQNCMNLADADIQGPSQANNSPSIAVDPGNFSHLVAAGDDYREGDRRCGAYYSLDNGTTWNDSVLPANFSRGNAFGSVAREYWQASGEASVAWDTKHNAYLSCLTFQHGSPTSPNPDESNAVYVFRSTQNNGASWNFTGHPVIEEQAVIGPPSAPLVDHPQLTIDNHAGSPFQDRIYVSWTLFNTDGTAYIFESHSNDYGQTFSGPVLVSTTSTQCPNTFGIATPLGSCNENQFSQPFTGPDGTLYVVYSNFNNSVASTPVCGGGPCDNHNQILMTKSTNGGASFSSPVKIGNYFDLPDCSTYQGGQNPFRSCVPEKGSSTNSVFTAQNYAVGTVNPANANMVAVTFGSYINPHSKESVGCTPAGLSSFGIPLYSGVKTPGACNNDILLSISTNHGGSFSGGSTNPRLLTSVNQATGQSTTDQWWQWAVFNGAGKLLVSYYDRGYGSDETTGSMDLSISSSTDNTIFQTARVTSGPLPLPTEFNGVSLGLGTGLAVGGTSAHPIWTDTRNSDLFLCPGTAAPGVPPALCGATEPNGLIANDQDIFTRAITE